MTTVDDLRDYFGGLDYKLIIAADGQTRSHSRGDDGRIVESTPAGGVSVAFDILCQAAGATYIARGRSEEDRDVIDGTGCVTVSGDDGEYTLKRLFLTPEEEAAYYGGYANQTLWPLSHVVFQRPVFNQEWFDAYAEVNRRFARAIEEEIDGKTFVWVNDYQLALVPGALQRRDDTVVGLFWHIPWPNWETFRILPQKREILESFLACDFIGFHRRYQARNFLQAVDRELGARIDYETSTVFVDGTSVHVASLPMGIDTDVIRGLLTPEEEPRGLMDAIRATFGFSAPPRPEGESNGNGQAAENGISCLFDRYKVMLGVDRLDYTKGIPERLEGIDCFFDENPEYREKVVYIGIMSPTRDAVPAYQQLREEVVALAKKINARYRTDTWEPLHLVYEGFTREDVMDLYRRAAVCLVTPLDDGMNLVSKEYIVAASMSENPGMLVLSQFAGSASDLAASLLVNPYDPAAISAAIKLALEMDPAERKDRIGTMVSLLDENNVYEWAISFVRTATHAARMQQHEIVRVV